MTAKGSYTSCPFNTSTYPLFQAANMVDASVVLAHIISQTRQNITFLVSQSQISAADGQEILSKLPSPKSAAQNTILTPPHSSDIECAPPPTAPPTSLPSNQARALWGYNEEGRVRVSIVTCYAPFLRCYLVRSPKIFLLGLET